MMMDEGSYHGVLQETVTSEAETGTLQLVLTFDVTHHWENEDWRKVPPEPRSVYLSLHENAMRWTTKKLQALGFNGNFDDPGFAESTRTEGIELRCRHEQYNGRPAERWELARWGQREIKKASQDKLRAMNARYSVRSRTSRTPFNIWCRCTRRRWLSILARPS